MHDSEFIDKGYAGFRFSELKFNEGNEIFYPMIKTPDRIEDLAMEMARKIISAYEYGSYNRLNLVGVGTSGAILLYAVERAIQRRSPYEPTLIQVKKQDTNCHRYQVESSDPVNSNTDNLVVFVDDFIGGGDTLSYARAQLRESEGVDVNAICVSGRVQDSVLDGNIDWVIAGSVH